MSITAATRLFAAGAAVAVLAVAVAPASAAAAAGSAWKAADLGSLTGGCCSSAAGINDRGDVVGESSTGTVWDPSHAVLWRHGRVIDLGAPGGGNSYATAINDAGVVVGHSDGLGATRWFNGRATALGTLGGGYTIATAVNNRGEIVGFSEVPGGMQHAFLWRAGIMSDLGAPSGGYTRALGINDVGQVVGESSSDGMNSVPVLWDRGVMRVLDSRSGRALDVNNHGDVVGQYSAGFLEAFLWQHGRITILALPAEPAPTPTFIVSAINDRGQVAGAGRAHAAIWQDGVFTTLPDLAGGSSGTGINERGQIAGYAYTAQGGSGNPTAVLWTH
ncbi:hypothetical protein [Dactylosporangium matsuzakiense]|uniref:HAF family extracellular repeat protein n=2 Tax=Dactylosporangium matsuzakiense TaxID=53360 RepID=A0A9W6KTN3_9ACTN|nr:hypothetical protein [Dactylosporangium matsuzakiense]GLL06499.1 hypothetical protein GCM10017581_082490 [Dactylosporangium matsuzakiense]